MNRLEEVLAHNARFVAAAAAPSKLEATPRKRLAVVTCIDTRLTGFMHEALGLERGDAIFIRVSGPTITSLDRGVLRSLAVAIFLGGVDEIMVIGHTECRLASDTLPVIDAVQKRGVSRDAFGSEDLRTWFGLFHSSEENVRFVVRFLRGSPVIPKAVAIHGLMIDSAAGKLAVIVRNQEVLAEPTAPPTAEVKIQKPMSAARPPETVKRTPPPDPKPKEARKPAPRARGALEDILKNLDRRRT